MEEELLKIFDEQMKQIGVAARSEAHKKGYWHETFQCWFIAREAEGTYIYLQLRSADKKDYPSLLDITAAGHILAHEMIEDGVREVEEEIGIHVTIEKLASLGIFKYCATRDELIDKELAHVYLYESTFSFDDFTLQQEEVAGILRTKLSDFQDLWQNRQEQIRIEGFIVNELGERIAIDENVAKDRFVPHEQAYYDRLIEAMYEYLSFR